MLDNSGANFKGLPLAKDWGRVVRQGMKQLINWPIKFTALNNYRIHVAFKYTDFQI